MLREIEHFLTTEDGARLCLVEVAPCSVLFRSGRHVFMTHGTFSDRRICMGLARHLAARGACCWVLEWRGHGHSAAAPAPFDFETIGRQDVPAALRYLVHTRGIRHLAAVTHSGGGIALTIALQHAPALQAHVDRAALFACQTSWAAPSGMARLQLRLASWGSRLLGRIPGRALHLGPHDEAHHTMRQWFGWNLSGRFHGRNGTDFLAGMRLLRLPVMAIAGEGDHHIAPPAACRRFLEAFGGPAKRFLLAGPTFGHASVLSSRASRSDIWPAVCAWLIDDASTKEAAQPS